MGPDISRSRVTFATTDAAAKIPSGTQVKVVKLLAGNTLQVEAI